MRAAHLPGSKDFSVKMIRTKWVGIRPVYIGTDDSLMVHH